ncbi:MAG: hypothetical protein GX366_01770 [Epulopiscium sp.]|nr:hypothetical protein [Candidatus Epulonipiscium sp.]
MKKFKVVFHISDPNKWNILLANISNILDDMGAENIEVNAIVNGGAVKEYIGDSDSRIISKINDLSQKGAKFMACNNALVANGLDKELLPRVVKVVPAGVSELTKKQFEGYAYIKP